MAKKKQLSTEQSYFENLKFDPSLLGSWVARYLQNFRIVLLLIVTITVLGLVSYSSLPKRLNPEVNIPIVTVVTVLPGASPEDIESLISEPIENKLKSVEGLDTITSSSTENVSAVVLQFQSSVAREKALNDTQTLVDTVTNLPEDAQTPQVKALDFEDQPILAFVITTTTDDRSLMSFASTFRDQLEELSVVDRVTLNGYEEQVVTVTMLPEKIREYGVNPLQLSQAIKQGLSSFPAGSIDSNNNTYSLTISQSTTSIEDIRNTLISVQGQLVRLGDMAAVEEQAKQNQPPTFAADATQEHTRGVTFYVYKNSSVSIDQAGKQVEELVDEIMAENAEHFTMTTIQNSSEAIEDQFSDLLGEFATTILLVFVCIFIFLGFRPAIISSLTVPLTFLSAFAFMGMFGQSINFLSLFAFLLALGLLVDDTIVVISAMTSYYRVGKFTPTQTGLLVWRDTVVPIWSTTLTTIWSFVPLLLASGIIGEFIKPIPVVVTITMISSTAIALLITLPIMVLILKPAIPARVIVMLKLLGVLIPSLLLFFFLRQNPLIIPIAVVYLLLMWFVYTFAAAGRTYITKHFAQRSEITVWQSRFRKYLDQGIISMDGFSAWYKRQVLRMLNSPSARRKTIAGVVLYAVVAFSLLPLGLVKNEFFPSTNEDLLYVSLELPAGATLSQTQAASEPILTKLRTEPDVKVVIAEVGKTPSDGFSGGGSGSNVSTFTLHLHDKADRERSSIEIAADLREGFAGYTSGKITVSELSGGPPAGADLQLTLSGDDLGELNNLADQVIEYLNQEPGVTNAEKSIKTGTSQIKFVPDAAKMSAAGLSSDQVGLWLRTYATGFTLDTITLHPGQTEKTDIVFQMSDQVASLEGLTRISVPNQQGTWYPLLTLGTLEAATNPTAISREDGKRIVTVTASVEEGYVVPEINTKLESFADTLELPDGYSWRTGGVNEENQDSINSILQAMAVSALLILVTMVIQFGSFRQAFIVLIVIPLAVSSVFLVFALTGTPLSFPALIGVLSLFGIVVTNSMFIVDKINLNRNLGMKLKEAIADAGASRMEPIVLTKLTTVLGLLPITISDPLWRGLGGAIISGLLVASSIMLLFIPALYYTIYQSEDEDLKKRN